MLALVTFILGLSADLNVAAEPIQCGCVADTNPEECTHVLLATPCYTASVTETYLLSVSNS
jgi:hypothetical protein